MLLKNNIEGIIIKWGYQVLLNEFEYLTGNEILIFHYKD